MNSHYTGLIFYLVSFLCPSAFLTPRRATFIVEQSYWQVSLSSAGGLGLQRPASCWASLQMVSDRAYQHVFFLEKTLSVVSYSFGIFHSSLTSNLGKVGLWVLQMSLSWYSRSMSLLHLRWMAPPLANNVPHFHLSSLLTRNFVVKITQPLFRAQTESY